MLYPVSRCRFLGSFTRLHSRCTWFFRHRSLLLLVHLGHLLRQSVEFLVECRRCQLDSSCRVDLASFIQTSHLSATCNVAAFGTCHTALPNWSFSTLISFTIIVYHHGASHYSQFSALLTFMLVLYSCSCLSPGALPGQSCVSSEVVLLRFSSPGYFGLFWPSGTCVARHLPASSGWSFVVFPSLFDLNCALATHSYLCVMVPIVRMPSGLRDCWLSCLWLPECCFFFSAMVVWSCPSPSPIRCDDLAAHVHPPSACRVLITMARMSSSFHSCRMSDD